MTPTAIVELVDLAASAVIAVIKRDKLTAVLAARKAKRAAVKKARGG